MHAIVLMDAKRGIAKNGDQPIHISNDLKRLRRLTEGSTIFMGRKTAEVIGHRLPNRRNIVVTSQRDFLERYPNFDGTITIQKLRDDSYSYYRDAWVLGGAQLYQTLMGAFDRIYVTEVNHIFHCDQFFPRIYRSSWQIVEGTNPMTYVDADGQEYDYRFITWERRRKRHVRNVCR